MPASAAYSISPNGAFVAASGVRVGGQSEIQVLSAKCLLKRSRTASCVRARLRQDGSVAQHVWSSDGTKIAFSFVTRSDFVTYDVAARRWSQRLSAPGTTDRLGIPAIVSPHFFNRLFVERGSGLIAELSEQSAASKQRFIGLSAEEREAFAPESAILSSAGAIIGWSAATDEASILSADGKRIALPSVLWKSATIQPSKFLVVTPPAARHATIWSDTLEGSGGVLEATSSNPKIVELPAAWSGPLRPIVGNATIVGSYSLDHVYGEGQFKKKASRIDAFFGEVRRRRPSYRLLKVEVSTTDTAALVVCDDFRGRQVAFVLDLATGKGGPVDDASDALMRADNSEQAIVLKGAETRARIIRHEDKSQLNGLVIFFRGGPGFNIRNRDRYSLIAELFDHGFDILIVDYHGSPGYGEKYYTSLAYPAANIITNDAQSALKWARAENDYARKPVGILGGSFGGLAAASSLVLRGSAPDFAIMDSPLIDFPERSPPQACSATTAWIFGAYRDGDGVCRFKTTGLSEFTSVRPIPTLVLLGDDDRFISGEVVKRWTKKVNSAGGCVTLLERRGGHGFDSLAEDEKSATRQAIFQWLKHAPDGCFAP